MNALFLALPNLHWSILSMVLSIMEFLCWLRIVNQFSLISLCSHFISLSLSLSLLCRFLDLLYDFGRALGGLGSERRIQSAEWAFFDNAKFLICYTILYLI